MACLLLVAGCGAVGQETPTEPAIEPAIEPAVEPVPAELPAVVARINGRSITRDELERGVRSAEIQAGQAVPAQFRDQVYRSVLDRLVAFHLLLEEGETLGIVVDDADVETRLEAIRADFPDDQAFDAQLGMWGTTLETMRAEFRRDLLVERVLEAEVLPGIDVDAATAREFYEQHPAQFTSEGGVRARHVLIGVSPDATDEEKAAARARTDGLLDEARRGGDFAELARTHSDDAGSAASGGDLGVVVRGQTVPDFETALFALQPGEFSDVVESPFGFHVIQMVAVEPARTVPFAEASVQIRDFLMEEERQTRIAALITRLKTNSDIEILL